MSSQDYDLDEMESIVEEFMVETKEIIQALDSNLVRLEKEPGNLDLLNEIFRSAHTMKGTSGFLGFNELMKLTHKMEDVLNRLRKAELAVTEDVTDILLEAVDSVKLVLQDITDKQQGRTDISDIIEKLVKINEGQSAAGEKPGSKNIDIEKNEPTRTGAAAAQAGTPPENEFTAESRPAPETAQTASAAAGASAQPRKDLARVIDSTIRVGVDRLDALVNMVGELVLGRNALVQTTTLLQSTHESERNVEYLAQATSQINFITTELHMAIMKMRMLQVGHVFNKFPRLVRDLSRDMAKKIDLIIKGEETELDKSVIEEINDPLVHLIRNCVDHGIELPDQRIKAGKPERGAIRLAAYQEGNNIVIEVADDGKGMDIEAIKKKAIERGLATSEQLAKLSQKEILSFIFQPGFSTAQKTTSVSGRGVGMDVVRTNIEKLKGTIELNSEFGKGSLIIIRLPLTLAIVQGLLVSCNNDVFAIPLTSVIETVVVTPEQVKYINQKPVIRLRDMILPIIELTEVLFGEMPERRNQLRIVVVGLAEKRLGLIVDSLIGQEEVVIKSIGEYLGTTPGVAGATIMGDGRVRLIIDLASLFNLVMQK
jgi:two-component system chemotaxis sensor kinase CheA